MYLNGHLSYFAPMSISAKNSLWYRTWKWYLLRCLELFYKRIEVSGLEHVPRDKAVIFASNHTNALMDPLVITYHSGRQHYFMTRGDVFQKPLLGKLFRSWRMLPIFRMKDGIKSLAKNEEIMNFMIDRLQNGHALIIFPEGSHFWERTVQPLKKGLVRMAFDVLEKKPDTDLQVVPVGLYFNNLVNVNQDALVSFGKPISIQDFPQDENTARTYQDFNKHLREEMRKLVIDIEQDEHYLAKDQLRIQLEKQLRHLSVKESFDLQRKFIHFLELLAAQSGTDWKSESLSEVLRRQEFDEIRDELKDKMDNQPGRILWLNWLKWPFYILAWIQLLPLLLVGKKVLSGIKDITFHNSVKFGLGMILQPIFTLILGGLTGLLFHSIWAFLIYLLLMPVWAALVAEFQSRKEYSPY